jgi:hypothetical protein
MEAAPHPGKDFADGSVTEKGLAAVADDGTVVAS